MVKFSNLLFLAITESHLDNKILDAEVQIPCYSLFRQDRVERTHGGAAPFVHSDLCSSIVAFCELLIVKITDLNLVIVVIYRPPGCPDDKFTENLKILDDSFHVLENDPKYGGIQY